MRIASSQTALMIEIVISSPMLCTEVDSAASRFAGLVASKFADPRQNDSADCSRDAATAIP